MARRLAAVGILVAAVVGTHGTAHADDPLTPPTSPNQGTVCADGVTAPNLDAFLNSEMAGITGADHQRPTKLPDGRVLWLFQDVFLRTAPPTPTAPGTTFVHNAGLIQSGRCFTLLTGPNATAWILGDQITLQKRWFWPMGGEYNPSTGNFDLLMAEMVEHGPTYLSKTEPVAMWRASIRLSDMRVVSARKAPNSSAELFGWSVASDATHTYLYSQCYRQFGWGWLGYDKSCTPHVHLARVPKGRLDLAPEYWDGYKWVGSSASAVDVFPTVGRDVNAVQVMNIGSQWVAITKVDDWWGKRILVESAPAPSGPWRLMSELPSPSRCGADCNTYFASWVPWSVDGSLIAGLSNNRWDGVESPIYRPSVFQVPRPPRPRSQQAPGPIRPAPEARFVPLAPCRLLDTRGGTPSPYPRQTPLTVQASGRCGVPADATAIATTTVAVLPTEDGHLSLGPAGSALPEVASLNYRRGEIRANSAIVRLGGGAFQVQSHAPSDIVVDVTGAWVPAASATAGRFVPVTPRRVLDTRNTGGRLRAYTTTRVPLPSGIPADATAVAMNITMVLPDAAGHLTAWPAGQAKPDTSAVNADRGGQVRGASVIVPVTARGINVNAATGTDITVDVTGYITGPSARSARVGLFVADEPVRVLDTRNLYAPMAASEARTVGTGAPASASAVAINVAAVLPARLGHLTVFPYGEGLPETASVNFADELAAANAAQIAQAGGQIQASNYAGGDLVIDRVGWFL